MTKRFLVLTRTAFVLFGLCMGGPVWAKPILPATPTDPVAEIKNFYVAYLNLNHTKPVPAGLEKEVRALFSKDFGELIDRDTKLCRQKAPNDMCGWGSSGDPFLNAQDLADDLTFAKSQFVINELPSSTSGVRLIEVTFNLFPGEADPSGEYTRQIQFEMTSENRKWVINNILYIGKTSADTFNAVDQIKAEIADLLKN